jgi:hypothetical protein
MKTLPGDGRETNTHDFYFYFLVSLSARCPFSLPLRTVPPPRRLLPSRSPLRLRSPFSSPPPPPQRRSMPISSKEIADCKDLELCRITRF